MEGPYKYSKSSVRVHVNVPEKAAALKLCSKLKLDGEGSKPL